MATIGRFRRSGGGFVGRVVTLGWKADVTLEPVGGSGDEGGRRPDWRVMCETSELGAAWRRQSREGRDYVAVKLDDPSLPEPLSAALFPTAEGDHVLVWDRGGERRDGGASGRRRSDD